MGWGFRINKSKAPALSPLLWLSVAYLSIFYVFPLLRLLALSVFDPHFTLAHYVHLIRVPLYGRVLINTFEVSLVVAFITLVLAYPTAYLIVTSPPRHGAKLTAIVLVPFFTSILVRNYAWIFLLGSHGVVNNILIG